MLTHDTLRRQLDLQAERLICAMRQHLGPDETMRASLTRQHSEALAEVKAELLATRAELAATKTALDKVSLSTAGMRGAAFEQFVSQTLVASLPHVAVEDVSKFPKAMDLVVEIPRADLQEGQLRVGIDAKDRTTSPTLAELARFTADMQSQRYDGAVLVLRGRATLQAGWHQVTDDLIKIGPRTWIVTRFESNPGMLGCALSQIAVHAAVDPRPLGSMDTVNALLASLAGPLREAMQLAAKTRDAASAFIKQLADQHVPLVFGTARDATLTHPDLQTLPVTNVFQSDSGLRAAVKRARTVD